MGVILFFGTFLLTHYVSLGSLLVYAGFLIEMVIMGQMDLFSMPVGHRTEMYVIAAFRRQWRIGSTGRLSNVCFPVQNARPIFLRKIKKR